MKFWPNEFVEEMEPEYIFDVPKEYQRDENTHLSESSGEDKVELGCGFVDDISEDENPPLTKS